MILSVVACRVKRVLIRERPQRANPGFHSGFGSEFQREARWVWLEFLDILRCGKTQSCIFLLVNPFAWFIIFICNTCAECKYLLNFFKLGISLFLEFSLLFFEKKILTATWFRFSARSVIISSIMIILFDGNSLRFWLHNHFYQHSNIDYLQFCWHNSKWGCHPKWWAILDVGVWFAAMWVVFPNHNIFVHPEYCIIIY